VVRVWADHPVPNQYLRVAVRETASSHAGLTPHPEGWPAESRRREYHVAAAEDPLRLVIVGPRWLRIDERRGERTIVRYRAVAEGVHELVLRPEGERDEALFRVFEKRPQHRAEEAPLIPPEKPLLPPLPPPALRLDPVPRPSKLVLEDVYDLGGQEDGTWTFGTSARRRRLFDEDSSAHDDFLELHAIHRYLDEPRATYFETGFRARGRERGGPTLELWESIRAHPSWFPAVLRFHTAGDLQFLDTAGHQSPAWSLFARGSISRQFSLCPTVSNLPSVSAFGRLLSLDNASAIPPGDLDPDVFTAYKRDHRWGLVLADTISYRPFLDTELRGRVSLTSNEDLGPDHAGGTIACSQYLYGLHLETYGRSARYFADADRRRDRTRYGVGFSLLYDLWAGPQDRLEFSFHVDHDLSDGVTAGFLTLAWHIGNGRGYRDFAPDAVSFRGLREDRIPPEYNNVIREQSRD
jgi:hypothetical protein